MRWSGNELDQVPDMENPEKALEHYKDRKKEVAEESLEKFQDIFSTLPYRFSEEDKGWIPIWMNNTDGGHNIDIMSDPIGKGEEYDIFKLFHGIVGSLMKSKHITRFQPMFGPKGTVFYYEIDGLKEKKSYLPPPLSLEMQCENMPAISKDLYHVEGLDIRSILRGNYREIEDLAIKTAASIDRIVFGELLSELDIEEVHIDDFDPCDVRLATKSNGSWSSFPNVGIGTKAFFSQENTDLKGYLDMESRGPRDVRAIYSDVVDGLVDPVIPENIVILGYKGDHFIDTGFVVSPYMLSMFDGRLQYRGASKVTDPKYYRAFKVRGLDTD